MPAINANGLRIVQAPGVVAVSHEVIHETRILYTDGRPHIGRSIRQWPGVGVDRHLARVNTLRITVTLTIDGTAIDGTVRVVTATSAISLEIFDGRVDGRTIVVKVKSPDGDRTITSTGTVTGDEMAFTRDIEVRPGVFPGGRQIFGEQGPRTFTATRVP